MGGKGAKDSIHQCPMDGVVITKTCLKQGAEYKQQKGDHGGIYVNGRLVTTIPQRDIGKGLYHAILKALAGAGFTLAFIGVFDPMTFNQILKTVFGG